MISVRLNKMWTYSRQCCLSQLLQRETNLCSPTLVPRRTWKSSIENGILYGPKLEEPLPQIGVGRYLIKRLLQLGEGPAQVYPEYGNKTFTFVDLAKRGARVSLALKSRGIGPGNVVLLATLVRTSFMAITLGTLLRGATIAIINPFSDAGDFERILKRVQPTIVISEPGLPAQVIRNYLRRTVEVVDMRACGVDDLSFLEREKSLVNLVDVDSYAEPDCADVLQETAFILFSSGTTGLAKGCAITHENFHAFVQSFSNSTAKMLNGMTMLQFAPVFWLSGIGIQMLALILGTTDVILTEFKENVVLNAVNDFKANFMLMDPHIAHRLAEVPDISQRLSPIRVLGFTGAAMDSKTQTIIQNTIKRPTFQAFGMTEVTLITTPIPGKIPPMGSVGVPQINSEMKIINRETKEILGPNKKGELVMRGPMIIPEYYRDPESTARAKDKEGWFHSGDLAYYDDQGYIYVVDRIKDLIKHYGYHVVPMELESILTTHPAVNEAAVIAVSAPLGLQLPRAYVVLKPGVNATEEELKDFVAGKVADYKQLRGGIKFLDALPRTPSMKVMRNKLKELAKEESKAQ